jgi:hypothetical protein
MGAIITSCIVEHFPPVEGKTPQSGYTNDDMLASVRALTKRAKEFKSNEEDPDFSRRTFLATRALITAEAIIDYRLIAGENVLFENPYDLLNALLVKNKAIRYTVSEGGFAALREKICENMERLNIGTGAPPKALDALWLFFDRANGFPLTKRNIEFLGRETMNLAHKSSASADANMVARIVNAMAGWAKCAGGKDVLKILLQLTGEDMSAGIRRIALNAIFKGEFTLTKEDMGALTPRIVDLARKSESDTDVKKITDIMEMMAGMAKGDKIAPIREALSQFTGTGMHVAIRRKAFELTDAISKNLSRGSVAEDAIHGALEAAANEGRIYAVMADEIGALNGAAKDPAALSSIFIKNLYSLNNATQTKQDMESRLADTGTRNGVVRALKSMHRGLGSAASLKDPGLRLAIVIENNDPLIVFKDAFNNVIAHSGKGEKTGAPFVSIYTGYQAFSEAVKSGKEGVFRAIVSHEARDIVRGYHRDEANTEVDDLYDKLIGRDIYDAEAAVTLVADTLYAPLHEKREYRITYDSLKLSETQVNILRAYVERLKRWAGEDAVINLREGLAGASAANTLISVECKWGSRHGESNVSVSIPEGRIEQYILRITGMVNMAIAASSIPDDITASEIERDYGHLIGFVKRQYKEITGTEIALKTTDPEQLKNALKNITLLLPALYRMPADELVKYYERALRALISA